MSLRGIAGLSLALAFALSGVAWAQTTSTGSIAGVVKDTSGAVMPGVTVEAASPALIDKVRVVISDDKGLYKIVDLPPPLHRLLQPGGVTTLKREASCCRPGCGSVNPGMRVGAIEESVTVSGQTPLVDVQNVQTQNVLGREHLDSLPSGRTIQAYAAFTLGMLAQPLAGVTIHDVGGNKGEIAGRLVMHGSRVNDQRYFLDGMSTMQGDSPSRYFFVNQVAAQEINITADAVPAESMTGGVQVNMIPKSGGNTFSGSFRASGTDSGLQSKGNLTQDLHDRGVTTSPSIRPIFDVGGGIGGPIKQDKLWFYTSHRYWGSGETAPGNYFNATPHTLFYTPDLNRPAYYYLRNRDNGGRVTWQANSKNRFTFYVANQSACWCFYRVDANRAPEATDIQGYYPTLFQGAWTYPVTSRLLIEAGARKYANH